jgi:hypothetical protein
MNVKTYTTLCPSPSSFSYRNTTFGKPVRSPSSDETKNPTQLGSLDTANFFFFYWKSKLVDAMEDDNTNQQVITASFLDNMHSIRRTLKSKYSLWKSCQKLGCNILPRSQILSIVSHRLYTTSVYITPFIFNIIFLLTQTFLSDYM